MCIRDSFGAFCVGLISQPDAHEKIGEVLSNYHSDIHHYCYKQMKNMWLNLINGMKCTVEEGSYFVMKAMRNLTEVV